MPLSQFPQWYHHVNCGTLYQDADTVRGQATNVSITAGVIPAAPRTTLTPPHPCGRPLATPVLCSTFIISSFQECYTNHNM